ncbi:MAG: zinc-dependent alcohol dehydrogenase [Acidimicrobiia bacterium]
MKDEFMQAVVLTGPNAIEVRDVPMPTAAGEAIVRIDQAGICGTDSKIVKGVIPARYPLVMGHEMSGEVVESAPGGEIPAGTRVIIDPAIFCNSCDVCIGDKRNLCRRGGLLGRDMDGTFCEYVTAGEVYLHVIPDCLDRDTEALLQVLGTVVHAQRTVSPLPDETAVVIGLGVSGLLQLQMLAARGVSVIGVTRSAWKRELADTFGAAATCPPDQAEDLVQEMTNGEGASVVVESVGSEQTLAQAIELAGYAGEIVLFGTFSSGSGALPYYQLYLKELTIYNPRAAKSQDYDSAIALSAAGKVALSPLVTARYPIQNAAAAVDAVGGDNLKVVLDMGMGN